jgi:inorganic triphosphatase YgiF
MTEFELKLEIPPERLEAVLAAMRADKTRRKRLQACYFDTKDESLARNGIVLRLRREGRAWVQTAKCAGSGPLERLEHNVLLGALPDAAPPDVSMGRHDGTPVGERIRQALGVVHDAGPDSHRAIAGFPGRVAGSAGIHPSRQHPKKPRHRSAKARKLLGSRLEKLHSQVGKDGRRFQQLDVVSQHRVRKRLKRLRYLAEFVAPLLPRARGGISSPR